MNTRISFECLKTRHERFVTPLPNTMARATESGVQLRLQGLCMLDSCREKGIQVRAVAQIIEISILQIFFNPYINIERQDLLSLCYSQIQTSIIHHVQPRPSHHPDPRQSQSPDNSHPHRPTNHPKPRRPSWLSSRLRNRESSPPLTSAQLVRPKNPASSKTKLIHISIRSKTRNFPANKAPAQSTAASAAPRLLSSPPLPVRTT